MWKHPSDSTTVTDMSIYKNSNCTVMKIPENKGTVNCYEIWDSMILYYYTLQNWNFSAAAPRSATDLSLHYCYCGGGILSGDDLHERPLTKGDYIIDCKYSADKRITSTDGTYIGITVICDVDKLNDYFAEFFADQEFDCCMREPYIAKNGKFTSKKVERLVTNTLALFCRCYNHLDYKLLKLKTAEIFCRIYDLQKDADIQSAQYIPKQKINQMAAVKTYLENHMDTQITLAEISNQHHMSVSSLKTSFKAVYGMPVYTYLRKLRLESAENMLLQTNQSVIEIANKVGYSNASKFAVAFKEQFGVSPSDIRKNASY